METDDQKIDIDRDELLEQTKWVNGVRDYLDYECGNYPEKTRAEVAEAMRKVLREEALVEAQLNTSCHEETEKVAEKIERLHETLAEIAREKRLARIRECRFYEAADELQSLIHNE